MLWNLKSWGLKAVLGGVILADRRGHRSELPFLPPPPGAPPVPDPPARAASAARRTRRTSPTAPRTRTPSSAGTAATSTTAAGAPRPPNPPRARKASRPTRPPRSPALLRPGLAGLSKTGAPPEYHLYHPPGTCPRDGPPHATVPHARPVSYFRWSGDVQLRRSELKCVTGTASISLETNSALSPLRMRVLRTVVLSSVVLCAECV